MEADLLRFYGVDLGDLYRGGLSLRRLSVLVAHLPADSAVRRAVDPEAAPWTLTDFLLADLYGALTGKVHPNRPTPGARSRATRHRDLVARLKAHRARTASAAPPTG